MSRRYRPFDPFERGGPLDARSEFRMPQVPRRFWRGVALFALAVLIFIAASPLVSVGTGVQWFDSLGYRDVYPIRGRRQAAVAIVTVGLAFDWPALRAAVALTVRPRHVV